MSVLGGKMSNNRRDLSTMSLVTWLKRCNPNIFDLNCVSAINFYGLVFAGIIFNYIFYNNLIVICSN